MFGHIWTWQNQVKLWVFENPHGIFHFSQLLSVNLYQKTILDCVLRIIVTLIWDNDLVVRGWKKNTVRNFLFNIKTMLETQINEELSFRNTKDCMTLIQHIEKMPKWHILVSASSSTHTSVQSFPIQTDSFIEHQGLWTEIHSYAQNYWPAPMH